MIPVIDGHNDLAWASREQRGYTIEGLGDSVPQLQTDLSRLRRGGLRGQFWSVWIDPVLQGAEQVTATLEQIDFIHRLVDANQDAMVLARTAADVRRAIAEQRVASLMGVEGGAQINGSLAVLRQYARAGVRYMTLTWNHTTEWADSATDAPQHGGLTSFGEDVVREMNRIGVVVDLSHVAASTMRSALAVSEYPVMASHSGARAVCDHPRNVPDDVVASIAAGGGVVMAPFVTKFVSQAFYDWQQAGSEGEPPVVTVTDVADHLDHLREVGGISAVGIGADFDGTDLLPQGLEDVSHYQELLAELHGRGWSSADLDAVAHENVLRVLEASDEAHKNFLAGRAGSPAPVAIVPAVDTNAREGHS